MRHFILILACEIFVATSHAAMTGRGFDMNYASFIAYTVQLQNFAQNVLQGRPAPLTVDDGVEAIRIAVAAHRAFETGQPVDVASVKS